jgi:hypothetical protein
MHNINPLVYPEVFKTTVQFFSHSPQSISLNLSLCLIDAANYRMSHIPYRNDGTVALQQDGTPPHFPTHLCTHFSVLSAGKWLDIYSVFPVPLVPQAWHFSVLVTGDYRSACRFFCCLQPPVRSKPPPPAPLCSAEAIKCWTERMLRELWRELR